MYLCCTKKEKAMSLKKPNVQSFISERFSPLAFSDKAVSGEDIRLLFEAARLAPSAFNEQPWKFVYAVKEEEAEYNMLLSFLVEGNRIWAKNAPLIGLSLAKLNFDRNHKPNRFALYDVGLAMGGLLAQATSMGLKVHQMGGFSLEAARAGLSIPVDFEPVAMFVIGYYGNPDDLSDDLRKRDQAERKRKPFSEIAIKVS